MRLCDPQILRSECRKPTFKDCVFDQSHGRTSRPNRDSFSWRFHCVGATSLRCIISGMQLGLMLLSWAAHASSQELTASQALQLLRENFHQEGRQGSLAVKRTSVLHNPANTGPTLSVSMEGAGRTDLYGIEQEISLFRQNKLLRRAGESAVDAEKADASHEVRQTEARMLEAFYQLIHAQERKKAIDHGIVKLEEVIRSLQKSHASGMRLDLDVFSVQHALAELGIAAAESEIAIMETRALLSGLLGERVDPNTLHASGTLDPRYELPSLQEAFVEALAARKDFPGDCSKAGAIKDRS